MPTTSEQRRFIVRNMIHNPENRVINQRIDIVYGAIRLRDPIAADLCGPFGRGTD